MLVYILIILLSLISLKSSFFFFNLSSITVSLISIPKDSLEFDKFFISGQRFYCQRLVAWRISQSTWSIWISCSFVPLLLVALKASNKWHYCKNNSKTYSKFSSWWAATIVDVAMGFLIHWDKREDCMPCRTVMSQFLPLRTAICSSWSLQDFRSVPISVYAFLRGMVPFFVVIEFYKEVTSLERFDESKNVSSVWVILANDIHFLSFITTVFSFVSKSRKKTYNVLGSCIFYSCFLLDLWSKI